MFWSITLNPIINIDTNLEPLSLSINLGGLVPGWNLVFVLVCWERETVSHRMNDHLVAVWAHSLGATVMASAATASAFAATVAATIAAATSAAAFGHSR
jgi:hypothetical protein